MKRFSTGVKTKCCIIFRNVYAEFDVWICYRDIWTIACALPELVNYGILYLIGYKTTVSEFIGIHYRIYRKSLSLTDVLRPVQFLHFFVNVFCRVRLEMAYRFKDSNRCMQLEICPIHQFLVSCERHHSTSNLYIVRPDLRELLCKNIL